MTGIPPTSAATCWARPSSRSMYTTVAPNGDSATWAVRPHLFRRATADALDRGTVGDHSEFGGFRGHRLGCRAVARRHEPLVST
jgi:hypothetical protein